MTGEALNVQASSLGGRTGATNLPRCAEQEWLKCSEHPNTRIPAICHDPGSCPTRGSVTISPGQSLDVCSTFHLRFPLDSARVTMSTEIWAPRSESNPNRYGRDPLTGRDLRQTSLPSLPKTLRGSWPRCTLFLSSSPRRCGSNSRPMVPLGSVHWKRRVS